jgi:hypothetical protein
MKEEQLQKGTKKEITTDEELTRILSNGKPTIVFVNDLSKLDDSLLARLRKILPVIILDENNKIKAENEVSEARGSNFSCLFIADSNIYLHTKEEYYSFGDINVIGEANILGDSGELPETKIEILPKK